MAQSGKMTAISIYNDHHVQALLNKFLNGEITTLEPIYSAQTGYHYPVVESILGNSSKVEPFLSKLSRLQFSRHFL
jgi:hypothetical protein